MFSPRVMSSPPSENVTLPSIRDIFPEYTSEARQPSHNEHPVKLRNPQLSYAPHGQHGAGPSHSIAPSYPQHHASHANPHERLTYMQTRRPSSASHPSSQPMQSPADFRGHQPSRSIPQSSKAYSRLHAPHSSPFPPDVSSPSSSENCAASSSSAHLHVNGSARNRAGERQAVSPGMVNGSSPAFRVSVSSLAPGRGVTLDGRASNRDADHLRKRTSMNGATGHEYPPYAPPLPPFTSAIISFPVSGTSASITPVTNGLRQAYPAEYVTDGSGSYLEGDKGKKHECTHCSKRFNRPSSLRIHVNTHTGLKPFECPFPRCGRQFNVNSNMRRHYRNHIRAGAAPVDDNMGRRYSGAQASADLQATSPSGWKHEGRAEAMWESFDDGEPSDDGEMDELDADDSSESTSSSSPPPASPPSSGHAFRYQYPDSVPDAPLPSSMVPLSSSPSSPRGAGCIYSSSSMSFVPNCKGPRVSTTLRAAFPPSAPLVRVKRERAE